MEISVEGLSGNRSTKHMHIIRRTGGDDAPLNPWEAMRRFLDEDWDAPNVLPSSFRHAGFPKVNISETEDAVKITADIPGLDPDKIEIEAMDDSISFSGKIEKETEQKNEKFYRYERGYGEFRRMFALPIRVKADKISAKSKNGVLIVILPKADEEKKKKVKVEAE